MLNSPAAPTLTTDGRRRVDAGPTPADLPTLLAAAQRRARWWAWTPSERDVRAMVRAESRNDRAGRCPFTYVDSVAS